MLDRFRYLNAHVSRHRVAVFKNIEHNAQKKQYQTESTTDLVLNVRNVFVITDVLFK